MIRSSSACASVTRYARLQLADDVVVLAVADRGGVGVERQRHDDLRVQGAAERRHHLARKVEALREHADHLVRLAVQDQRAPHGTRIAAEPAQPGAHVRGRPCRRCRASSSCGPRSRPYAARAPSIGSRFDDARIVPTRSGAPSPGQVVVRSDGDRELLEALVTRLDVEVLRGREPVFRDAQARRAVPEDHEPLRVRVRQRPQQQRARDAEDGGIRADPDRERQHHGYREAGAASERAQRVREVAREAAHESRSTQKRRVRASVRIAFSVNVRRSANSASASSWRWT